MSGMWGRNNASHKDGKVKENRYNHYIISTHFRIANVQAGRVKEFHSFNRTYMRVFLRVVI